MRDRTEQRRQERLARYLEESFAGLGRSERRRALTLYSRGLLLQGERKSLEPMAHRLAREPGQGEALRQRMQQAVVVARWDTQVVYERVASRLRAALQPEVLVIDDTGFAKKGCHSVGVGRQYSGTLGRVDNCQVGVSVHVASERGGGCIGMRLFLPQAFAQDSERRRRCHVPEAVKFETKGQLAMGLLRQAKTMDIGNARIVLADAGYGDSRAWREQLVAEGFEYVVGTESSHSFWPALATPVQRPPGPRGGQQRRIFEDPDHPPVALADLAPTLSFRRVTWRTGSRGKQSGNFAALRLRSAEGTSHNKPPGEPEWVIVERTQSDKRPYKFWLSNLPPDTPLKELVRLLKMRWHVERNYQEMKGQLGLDHFEGRTWPGWHHHTCLVALVHAFVVAERVLFSPQQTA